MALVQATRKPKRVNYQSNIINTKCNKAQSGEIKLKKKEETKNLYLLHHGWKVKSALTMMYEGMGLSESRKR